MSFKQLPRENIDPRVFDLAVGDLVVVKDLSKLSNKIISSLAEVNYSGIIVGFQSEVRPKPLNPTPWLPTPAPTNSTIEHFTTFNDAYKSIGEHYSKWTTPDRVNILVYISDTLVIPVFPMEVTPITTTINSTTNNH